MKNLLISSKIVKDSYGQFGQFLDLAWFKFFQNKVNLFTVNVKNQNSINNINFDGLILSGGNDLYSIKKKKENLIRDKYELKLLKYAIKKSIPIVAVCRGFQFVNDFFGGSLKKIKNHTNKNHEIIFNKNFSYVNKKKMLNTNSYHNYAIRKLADNFEKIAETDDNSIEIAFAKKEKILGLMFHPERENLSQLMINKLVFNYFKIK